jgi:heat-inducible transcriptional repressor
MTVNPRLSSSAAASAFAAMDQRSRAIFREIVQAYLDTGEPVGSRTISRRGVSLSPASIRNVMSDLAEMGLLDAPHTSAGRVPTHAGLRMFVDSLLQIGEPSEDDKRQIESRLAGNGGRRFETVLAEASGLLSGLVGGAGLVSTPTQDAPIRHIEFVRISSEQALAVIVADGGGVENRLLALPAGLPASALIEAGNFLNARMKGRTLAEAREAVIGEVRSRKAALDEAASRLVEDGLAQWSGEDPYHGRSLIVRGRANLVDQGENPDLDKVRDLFEELEKSENLLGVLDTAREGEGVRLFIGTENPLFSLSGSATIVAPYMNAERKIVGALGVIGPTRINYARIIPMVDYTAQVISRLLGDPPRG